MSKTLKRETQSLGRSIALTAAVILGASSPAYAITNVNNVVGTPVNQGGTCIISASSVVTGNINDSGGSDFGGIFITDSGGTPLGAPAEFWFSISVGTTAQRGTLLNVGNTARPAANFPLQVSIRESTAAAAQSGGAVLGTAAISSTAMIQAGGSCATVASSQNTAPTANAGPDQTNINNGTQVQLDGSASTDAETPTSLTYSWVQVNNGAPSVTLSNAATTTPSFTPPLNINAQTYQFQVTVNDGLTSSTDTVDIDVNANQSPVAVGSASTVTPNPGQTVVLDGNASSDPDGNSLVLTWTQDSGPASNLAPTATGFAAFNAPVSSTASTQVFRIFATDGLSSSSTTVTINTPAASNPVANAGPDQSVTANASVTLDGSASADPNSLALSYSWTQTSGPAVSLSGSTAASPSFTAPNVLATTALTFDLVVNNGLSSSVADSVSITVNPLPVQAPATGSFQLSLSFVGQTFSWPVTTNLPGAPSAMQLAGGTSSFTLTSVAAGSYSLSFANLSGQSFVISAITCSNANGVSNLASQSISITIIAGGSLTCAATAVQITDQEAEIAREFASARQTVLLQNQPSLDRRMNRLQGTVESGGANFYNAPLAGPDVPFIAQFTEETQKARSSLAMFNRMNGNVPSAYDVWAEVSLGTYRADGAKGRYVIAQLGADVLLTERVLAGLQVQYDSTSWRKGVSDASGSGFMAGPYISAKLSENIFAHLSASYGWSSDKVDVLGTGNAVSYRSRRLLLSAATSGTFDIMEGLTFAPTASISYIRETIPALATRNAAGPVKQTVSTGEAVFAPRFNGKFELGDGLLASPFIEFAGIYSWGSAADTANVAGLRGRVKAGSTITAENGVSLNTSVGYDGIGKGGFGSLSGRIGLDIAF